MGTYMIGSVITHTETCLDWQCFLIMHFKFKIHAKLHISFFLCEFSSVCCGFLVF